MNEKRTCERDGCNRIHTYPDPYCSAECARVANGLEEPFDNSPEARAARYNRRKRVNRLRKKHGSYVTFENPEMMEHVIKGKSTPARPDVQGHKMVGEQ